MEIFSVSILSKVLSLDKLSCPQIWNIQQEKDREKEKVGGRPTKLNEKKGDGDFKKNCSGGEKMRNASGHQKSERVRHFLHKTCN